jgi:hypothetical protein
MLDIGHLTISFCYAMENVVCTMMYFIDVMYQNIKLSETCHSYRKTTTREAKLRMCGGLQYHGGRLLIAGGL